MLFWEERARGKGKERDLFLFEKALVNTKRKEEGRKYICKNVLKVNAGMGPGSMVSMVMSRNPGDVHVIDNNNNNFILIVTLIILYFQLSTANVGLTENVEGEPTHFMVWVGSSMANALVLHTFEVNS